MFEFLYKVLSSVGAVFILYMSVAGIITVVRFVLHLLFPNYIKCDNDYDDESGRYDGWSH